MEPAVTRSRHSYGGRRKRPRQDTAPIAPASATSRRVCFLGDSIVLGVGDPTHRGWVGHVPRLAAGAGVDLTAYNLGIRGQTTPLIAERFPEALARLPQGQGHLVVSGGINDTDLAGGRVRSTTAESVAALRRLLGAASSAGIDTLVVSPTPVADAGHQRRLEGLSEAFSALTTAMGVPYVDVMSILSSRREWGEAMTVGDGYHPAERGYRHLASTIWAAGMCCWLDQDLRHPR
ncbi:GDSL-type esterase/lipase family protein [Streptomyces marianii]|nr:GDSL-type esterase/lipase family protein [Streptomyces marianii]